MKWNDIKNIIDKEVKKSNLNEATVSADEKKFNLRTGVNKNPTKLGIKIQFEPKGEFLAPDIKGKLEVALQEKLNAALLQYNIQVSKDTDVPREHVIGFFIPISQVKNLIVKALGGADVGADIEEPKVAAPPPPEPTTPPPPPPPMDDEEEITELAKKYLEHLVKNNIL